MTAETGSRSPRRPHCGRPVGPTLLLALTEAEGSGRGGPGVLPSPEASRRRPHFRTPRSATHPGCQWDRQSCLSSAAVLRAVSGRTAFTLTELLCALLIIAVTVSFLATGLVRSRHRVDVAACSSNLRQVGLALRIYAAAHDGHLPPRDNDWTPLATGPYLPDERVLGCPALAYDPGAGAHGTPLSPLHPGPRYLYTGGLCDDDDPTREVARDSVPGVHMGVSNVLFLDGHTEAVRGKGVARP